MAKNGAHGRGYLAEIARRSQIGEPKRGNWIRRDPDEGRIVRPGGKSRGSFKDVPWER